MVALDASVLDELVALGMGDEFEHQFVRQCLEDAQNCVGAIERDGTRSDWEQLRESAHALRGVASNLGLAQVAGSGGELMRMADWQLQAEWRQRLSALLGQLQAGKDALDARVKRAKDEERPVIANRAAGASAGIESRAARLRSYQSVHRAQRFFAQLHRCIYPDLGDAHHLFQRYGGGHFAYLLHRCPCVRRTLALTDHLFHCSHTLAAWDHAIDQPHGEQFFSRVQIAIEHDPLRQLRADALAHKRVGTHAREQIEQDFGQPHHHAFLGNDGMAAQCRLETAAQRIALDQSDAVRTCAEANVKRVHPAHATLRVVEQAGAIAFANQLAEQRQITAKVENVAVRCQHHVWGRRTGMEKALAEARPGSR